MNMTIQGDDLPLIPGNFSIRTEGKNLDFETMGIGAGSGFVSAVLTLLGWNRRLNRQEEKLEELEKEKIGEKMCDQKHKEVTQMQGDIKEIKDMVNRLLFNQLNGVGGKKS